MADKSDKNVVDVKSLVNPPQNDTRKTYYQKMVLGDEKEVYSPKDDKRRVVIHNVRLLIDEVGGREIPVDVEKPTPISIKKGSRYKVIVEFNVQHDIVPAFRMDLAVFDAKDDKSPVDKMSEIVGTFAPRKLPHKMVCPAKTWNELPDSEDSKGNYVVDLVFTSDEKDVILKARLPITIVSEWPKEMQLTKKLSLTELVDVDEKQDSRAKYYKKLALGNEKAIYSPSNDKRHVVINKLFLIVEGREGKDVDINLEKPTQNITFKRGSKWRVGLNFTVQHDIVSTLRYDVCVTDANKQESEKEKIVILDHFESVVGSFAPRKEPYDIKSPSKEWFELPDDGDVLGKFNALVIFSSDDKETFVKANIVFNIVKDCYI